MNKNSESAQRATTTSRAPALAMDGAGIVVDWSTEAEQQFGWSRHEAIGRKLSELIIPERHRAVHEAGLKHFMTSKGRGALLDRKLDLVMLHRDGREFPLSITIGSEESGDKHLFPTFIERE
jgi:two-component system cell cycle sensor histidine kinase/response regulator CckA